MGAETYGLPPGERCPSCFECVAPLPPTSVPQSARCLAGSSSICPAPGSGGVGSVGDGEKERLVRFLLFRFCLLPASVFWNCWRKGRKVWPMLVLLGLVVICLRLVKQDSYLHASGCHVVSALVEEG